MRKTSIPAAILMTAGLSLIATPFAASAQEHHRHRVEVCRDVSSRGARNTGTAVGAVAGGLAGNALSHGGGRTGGTILGAVAGGVIGHQYAKHNATHRVCHWEWR